MTVVAIVIAVLALGVALVALRRADVVERRAKDWRSSAEPGSQPAARPAVAVPGASGETALRRVAVVRYDAFEDLGGRMSFSAAVLDDAGRGLVLTAIHGRSETRSYVKQVPPQEGERELSGEEQQAVREAMRQR